MKTNLSIISLSLLDSQVDLILQALQLYAFNFHNTWNIQLDEDKKEIKNALIFHTYEEILQKYNNEKVSYDVLKACRLEKRRRDIKRYYSRKKIA